MRNDPAGEWRMLTEHYGAMFDGELEELARDQGDLTETAREALRIEMKNRRLAMPSTKAEAGKSLGRGSASEQDSGALTHEGGSAEGGDGAQNAPLEFTWKVPLCDCEDEDRAWQVSQVLKRAGIESWMVGTRWNRSAAGIPGVLVAADQLDEARAVVSQPIPQDIIEESKLEVPEFEAPVCPECGAVDPVLESAEPTNAWLCEACGFEWAEPPGLTD